jgi:hypothetical protein
MTTDPTRFFDSHGNLWESCPCDHPEAQNFGPEWCAHPIAGPSRAEAAAAGRVDDSGEWDILMPPRSDS